MSHQPVIEAIGAETAGFVSRLLAIIIDIVIVSGAILTASAMFDLLINFVSGLDETIEHLLMLAEIGLQIAFAPLYFVLLTGIFGRTVGKAIMGLAVVTQSGQPLTIPRATFRLVAQVLVTIGPSVFAYLWLLVDDRRRTWHDILSRTAVVYSNETINRRYQFRLQN